MTVLNLIVGLLYILPLLAEKVHVFPSVAEVFEHEKVNLTCNYTFYPDGSYRNVTWFRYSGIASEEIAEVDQSKTCSVLDYSEGAVNYTTSCGQSWTTITLNKVRRERNGEVWSCRIENYGRSNNSTLFVIVPIAFVNITKPEQDVITVKERENVTLVCETSPGRPAANITWVKSTETETIGTNTSTTIKFQPARDNLIISQSVLRISPARGDNKANIFCYGKNSEEKKSEISRTVLLNVLFPPETGPKIIDHDNGSLYTVAENSRGNLSCIIPTSNPNSSLEWSCYDLGTLTATRDYINSTVTWTAVRNTDRKCVCNASNVMTGNQYVYVNVEILFPPTAPIFWINSTEVSNNNNVSIVRGNPLAVKCKSFGKPKPSLHWEGQNKTQLGEETLKFDSIEITDGGEYTCHAQNTMNLSSGESAAGKNSSSIEITILYPPSTGRIDNTSAVEGSLLKVQCPYKPGNPLETNIKWTREIDEKQWNERELSISNISRTDATKYTCCITNLMKPTNAPELYGNTSVSFFLNVLYKSSVGSFYVDGFENRDTVTVNEGSDVTFNCVIKSNPASDITLAFRSQTIKRQSSSNRLTHTLPNVTCFEAGVYTCEGMNKYNDGQPSKTDIELFVQCKPRAFGIVAQNVTSKLHESATFNFTALLYPQPDENELQWRKWHGYKLKSIVNDSSYVIYTSHLEINGVNLTHTLLTVLNVTPQDFGIYSLSLENSFGTLNQSFYLIAEDKPQPPISFTHLESFTTDSTITVRWKPGFNGGYSQFFFLKFKQADKQYWFNVSIEDTGDEEMNYTLSNLSPNTEFKIKMFAMNTIGRSEETVVLTLKTKNNPQTVSPSKAAVIGGCVAGVAVVVVLPIIGFIVKRRGFYLCKKKKELAKENDDVHSYDTLQELHTYNNTAAEYELLQIGTIQTGTAIYENVNGVSTDTAQQPYVNINTITRAHENYTYAN